MDIGQDIWLCKMRYLLVYICWIYLLKSIKKNNKNRNRYGIENIMQSQNIRNII
jgi:hypothetical protein